jgi:Beta-lactamase
MNLVSQMKALSVPAVSIAAIRNGTIDWARAYGVSSAQSEPVSTETLFGAASISKPVTALGVLKLVEEGKIDLDTNVNQYLKQWKIPDNQFTANQKVTVHELLNHTSGIGTHNGEIMTQAPRYPHCFSFWRHMQPQCMEKMENLQSLLQSSLSRT